MLVSLEVNVWRASWYCVVGSEEQLLLALLCSEDLAPVVGKYEAVTGSLVIGSFAEPGRRYLDGCDTTGAMRGSLSRSRVKPLRVDSLNGMSVDESACTSFAGKKRRQHSIPDGALSALTELLDLDIALVSGEDVVADVSCN
jgi:hypothetical protein